MRHDAHAGTWGIWCKGPPGAQQALVGGDPERFFRPPYVGVHGWIGISLAADQDWAFVADLIEDAYRMTARTQRWTKPSTAIAAAGRT